MLVCPSCNRKKSWACEHCPNWLEKKDPDVCGTCFWASPEKYEHVAMKKERRVEIVWRGEDEVREYESLKSAADDADETISEYGKRRIKEDLE
jgi:hypothetical protein